MCASSGSGGLYRRPGHMRVSVRAGGTILAQLPVGSVAESTQQAADHHRYTGHLRLACVHRRCLFSDSVLTGLRDLAYVRRVGECTSVVRNDARRGEGVRRNADDGQPEKKRGRASTVHITQEGSLQRAWVRVARRDCPFSSLPQEHDFRMKCVVDSRLRTHTRSPAPAIVRPCHSRNWPTGKPRGNS